jgi:sterol desaturase/sphingolipid hydroxylase (fatty acid hydroxylase superfamily)
MIEQVLEPWVLELTSSLINPQKRIFWGYLLSATVIAFLWLRFACNIDLCQSCKVIFNKEIWFSKSAKTDYLVMFLNSLILTIISPRLLAKATVAYFIYDLVSVGLQGTRYFTMEQPQWFIAFGFTFFLFVFDDFARYWVHRWMHTVPILWSFHKVHHSATSLNPFTIFRTHPVEIIIFSIRSAIVQGFTTGIFFFMYGNQVSLLIILGASVFTFSFNALGSNLRHSPISIRYWRPIEYVLMSPAQHHIHHSIADEHRNKNYGVALSIWDWLFGTICLAKQNENYNYGLNNKTKEDVHDLKNIYVNPFKEVLSILMKGNPEKKKLSSAKY